MVFPYPPSSYGSHGSLPSFVQPPLRQDMEEAAARADLVTYSTVMSACEKVRGWSLGFSLGLYYGYTLW